MNPLNHRRIRIAYAVLNTVNRTAVRSHFSALEFHGNENIPGDGPFLLVCNHISRWDGLVLHEMLGRPANWMVSPNELKGLQGAILRSMGAFPAAASPRLVDSVRKAAARGEGLVIFPEGDIKRDGRTHPFKNGASRLALSCAARGIDLHVIPAAIHYRAGAAGEVASVMAAPPVDLGSYTELFREHSNMGIRALSVRLHREVCHLRYALGSTGDNLVLFIGEGTHRWAGQASAGEGAPGCGGTNEEVEQELVRAS